MKYENNSFKGNKSLTKNNLSSFKYSFSNIELDDLYEKLSVESKKSFYVLNNTNIEDIKLSYFNSLEVYNRLVNNNRKLNGIMLKFKKLDINSLDENTQNVFFDINTISRILAILLKNIYEYKIDSSFKINSQYGGSNKNISKKNKAAYCFSKNLLDKLSWVFDNAHDIAAAGLFLSGYPADTILPCFLIIKGGISILKFSFSSFSLYNQGCFSDRADCPSNIESTGKLNSVSSDIIVNRGEPYSLSSNIIVNRGEPYSLSSNITDSIESGIFYQGVVKRSSSKGYSSNSPRKTR
jgi:hypothetical protein